MLRSLNEISQFLGCDRATVSKRVNRAGIKPTPGPRQSKLVNVTDLLTWKVSEDADLSPADRRNLSQAKKLDIEAAILQRDWVPVADAAATIAVFLDHLQKIIDDADFPPAKRTALVEKIHSIRVLPEEQGQNH